MLLKMPKKKISVNSKNKGKGGMKAWENLNEESEKNLK